MLNYLKNEYRKFFENYFDNIIICLKEIIYLGQKILIFVLAIILSILAIPFIRKINIFIQHLIELFKTNNYRAYFVNYFNTFNNCILEIIHFCLKILNFSLAIILTILATPFIWKLHKFIQNLIELIKTKDIKKFIDKYFDSVINSFVQILNLGQHIIIHFIAIILTIIAFPFIWKLKQFIQNLITLFKTKEYKNFFINYYNILIDCFIQLYTFIFILIIFYIAIIITIITIPFIWNLNKFIKNLIELFKTKEYKQFFINYYENIINTFKQILNLGKQIIIFSIAIILIPITIPFLWKLKKFIKNFIELFKTKEYKQFFHNYFKNLLDCFIEILLSIPVVLNHLSIFHLKALYDIYYNNKEKEKIDYLYLNL